MQRTPISTCRGPLRTLALALAFCAAASPAAAQDTLVPPPTTAATAPEAAPSEPRTNRADLNPRPLGSFGRASDANRTTNPATTTPARPESTGGTLIQTLGSLGMVLGLILALAAGARKLSRSRGGLGSALGAMGGGPSPAGIIEVLGRYPFGRGTNLVLLKLDRRILLIAQGTTGLRLRGGSPSTSILCEITDPDDVASILVKANEADGRSIGESFRQALAGFERQHDGVIESPRPSLLGRLVRRGDGGDRTELLDARAITPSEDPLRLADFDRPAGDVVGSLRSRLGALRSGGAA